MLSGASHGPLTIDRDAPGPTLWACVRLLFVYMVAVFSMTTLERKIELHDLMKEIFKAVKHTSTLLPTTLAVLKLTAE